MAFQDDLQKLRAKFSEAEKLEIVQGEVKDTSEALAITLLSEFEKHRVSYNNEIDSNNKKIEEFKKQILSIQSQISEIEKQNTNINININIYNNLGSMVNSSIHSFLVRAGKLKEEERRQAQYELEKQKAIAEMKKAEEAKAKAAEEARLKAEAEAKAKAAEEARLKAEAEAKAAEEVRLKAEAQAAEEARLKAESEAAVTIKKKSRSKKTNTEQQDTGNSVDLNLKLIKKVKKEE